MASRQDTSTAQHVDPDGRWAFFEAGTSRRKDPSGALRRWLRSVGVMAGSLKAGDTCPAFMLPDINGHLVDSTDLLRDRPLVLSFYQGAWCRASMAHLLALHSAQSQIAAAGADLVVVTPEPAALVRQTSQDHHLDLQILCDIDYVLCLEFGVLFRVPLALRGTLLHGQSHLSTSHGSDEWLMPIQSTFIIQRSGAIVAAQLDVMRRAGNDAYPILSKIGLAR